jgi:hypothetical protein
MDLVTHITTELRSVYGERKWIIATDVLAGAASTAGALQRLGATSALCVAASPGTGAGPDPEFAPDPIVFDVSAASMMEGIRASAEQLANLPAKAVAQIDAFDPERVTRVIGTIFDDGRPVGGRTKYGARPASWQALEDKVTVDALWDAIGVQRAESRIVLATDVDALRAATREMDRGDGAVWSADAREGFHGGAAYTRWVETEEQILAVQAELQPHADQIRVMPYLRGIPCSIHGMVFDGYVVALRPCEMIVFRQPGGRFLYAHAATFWDPPQSDRDEMRAVARRTGEYLRTTVDYRGAFTVDGVMTSEGFRPTELNPRFGAALGKIGLSVDLPLPLLNFALVERESCDWRPREFEALLLEAADVQRAGATMAVFPKVVTEMAEMPLVYREDRFRPAEDGEEPDANAKLGPSAAGGIVFVTFVSDRTPAGPSVAPRAAAALAWADEHWQLGIGPLSPAVDGVRDSSAQSSTPRT